MDPVTGRGRLRGRTVVVTGAARGLGRAVAFALAREQAALVLCDRLEAELDRTAARVARTGARVEARCVDLAARAELSAFASWLRERGEGVDGVVNNAGVLHRAGASETSDPLWDETLAVNLTAPFVLTRALLPGLRERGGAIVNVSSRAGAIGFAAQTAYCAAKFGLEGWSRALAAELESEGAPVSVNTITPGAHIRIKPTMMTDEEEAAVAESERVWEDGSSLGPAFVVLLEARGKPTGLRFDAARLCDALAREGPLSHERIEELAE